MTMHLEGPWLSTTSTRKRAEKITKARQEELERDWRARNKWLKDLHLPKQTFEEYLDWLYGRGEKTTNKKISGTKPSKAIAKAIIGQKSTTTIAIGNALDKTGTKDQSEDQMAPKSRRLWVTGPCTTKPTPVYTGTKIIGIGTMHKSNAVPIFSDEEAKDISSMRR